jgi:tRNA (cmo5U34)-methyltransferase
MKEHKNPDKVFSEEIKKPSDFKFGAVVANAFDDMVERSVPFYNEIQRMIIELAIDHALPETHIVDLGCSTGTTMIGINPFVEESISFIGVDDSPEMLQKCADKLEQEHVGRRYDLVAADLNSELQINNASVVILCLTLQFVRPLYRERLIKTIYNGLVSGGVLIVAEKILAEETVFNRKFIKYYYDYKRRNQYSEMEISQKREALENVLVPYKLSENIKMLKEAGFSNTETFFKWYNFAGFIAMKQ